MSDSSRFAAVIAYLIPVIGWLYVFVFHRSSSFALYHLRQAVGLFLFFVLVLAGWALIAWVLAWIPLLVTLSVSLFTIVIMAYMFGFVAWILGLINVLNRRAVPLPWFGRWAAHLPIQ